MTRGDLILALIERFGEVMQRPATLVELACIIARAVDHMELGGAVDFRRYGNSIGMRLLPLPHKSEVQS